MNLDSDSVVNRMNGNSCPSYQTASTGVIYRSNEEACPRRSSSSHDVVATYRTIEDSCPPVSPEYEYTDTIENENDPVYEEIVDDQEKGTSLRQRFPVIPVLPGDIDSLYEDTVGQELVDRHERSRKTRMRLKQTLPNCNKRWNSKMLCPFVLGILVGACLTVVILYFLMFQPQECEKCKECPDISIKGIVQHVTIPHQIHLLIDILTLNFPSHNSSKILRRITVLRIRAMHEAKKPHQNLQLLDILACNSKDGILTELLTKISRSCKFLLYLPHT